MGKIYKIAIVEDEEKSLNNLVQCLKMYEEYKNLQFMISVYRDCNSYLSEGRKQFDIVFMDIDLPGMTGMECARRLRETDNVVTLIFVTQLAQYAIEGYSVSALDYIVKPVTFKDIVAKLDRALEHIDLKKDKYIEIQGKEFYRINLNEIIYIDITGHKLTLHLFSGQEVEGWGTLKKLAEELAPYGFVCCNSYCLVNLKYITSLKSTAIKMVGDIELTITRRRKEQFLAAFAEFSGGGCVK